MIGEYLRLTTAELDRAIGDPDWALEFADELNDALMYAEDAGEDWDGADVALARGRCFSTEKAWNAIAFLLQRASFPVDVVFGEGRFADGADWGYGPPGYLSAEQVQVAADALGAARFDALVRGVEPSDLEAADVYPMVWDEPNPLEWVGEHYRLLTAFFRVAAKDGDAMLVWLS